MHMIVTWPDVKPGSLFTGNVVNYDFLPTIVDWSGGDPEAIQDIDRVSRADYMAGKVPNESFLTPNLYSHYPHHRNSIPHSAMISGSLKVIHSHEKPDIPMLFDLSHDIVEVTNLAKIRPRGYREQWGLISEREFRT